MHKLLYWSLTLFKKKKKKKKKIVQHKQNLLEAKRCTRLDKFNKLENVPVT
jgi:hypothetical protein